MMSTQKIHPSHPYDPLKLMDRPGVYTCDGCRMDGIGPRYRCDCHNYDLHQECFLGAPTITFQGQKCHFMEKPLPAKGANCQKVGCKKCGRSCDACGMTVEGFVYHNPENGWDFHPQCTKLQSEICIGDVVFRLEKQGPSKCKWCKEKWVKGSAKKIPGWCFTSKHKDYNFHVYCVMQMAIRFSTTGTATTSATTTAMSTYRHVSSGGGGRSDESSLGMAIEGLKQVPLAKMCKSSHQANSGSLRNKWGQVLQVFLRTVFSILLGDPTTLLANSLAHVATQAFSNLTE